MTTPLIRIPRSDLFTPDQFAELQAANPGLKVVAFVPGSAKAAADGSFHAETVSVWTDLVRGLLQGAVSFVPVPDQFRGLVNTILDRGVDAVERALSSEPTRERWTLTQIQALAAELRELPGPRT